MDTLRKRPPGLKEADHAIFAHKPWPELGSRFWAYEMFWNYGADWALFRSRVLGEFPTREKADLALTSPIIESRSLADELSFAHRQSNQPYYPRNEFLRREAQMDGGIPRYTGRSIRGRMGGF
jgi:hypothetical protein